MLLALQVVDFPHMKERARSKLHEKLTRVAEMDAPVARIDVTSKDGRAALAAMGIAVDFPAEPDDA